MHLCRLGQQQRQCIRLALLHRNHCCSCKSMHSFNMKANTLCAGGNTLDQRALQEATSQACTDLACYVRATAYIDGCLCVRDMDTEVRRCHYHWRLHYVHKEQLSCGGLSHGCRAGTCTAVLQEQLFVRSFHSLKQVGEGAKGMLDVSAVQHQCAVIRGASCCESSAGVIYKD